MAVFQGDGVTGASESFVILLARASKKATRQLKRYTETDRDDIIAIAILWCWENKDKFEQTGLSLDQWFTNAVRNAKVKFSRDSPRHASAILADIPVVDEAEAQIELADWLNNITLPTRKHKKVLGLCIQGYSRAEIVEQGYEKNVVDDVRAKLAKYPRAISPRQDFNGDSRTARGRDSDNPSTVQASIDRAIEQLEFAPPAGKECPPCWRCKWFVGLLPRGKRHVQMETTDPDIQKAILSTNARKVEIAQGVTEGTLGLKSEPQREHFI